MKLVCNCGNECELIEDNGDRSEEDIAENGSFADLDCHKFDSWAEHDECGFTCQKCGKQIWMFT